MPGKGLSIAFRALEEADLPLMRGWIARPHWQDWWGEPDTEINELRQSIDSDAVEPMIVEIDGRPAAFVQSYDPHLEEDHPYQDQPFGTLGIDISIADAGSLGKGLGPAILDALAGILFDEGALRLIIDPDPANRRAIRAYEKAGFLPLGERDTPFGRVLLMARDTDETED